MKVLLFNGSPHKDGCTFTVLNEIQKTLKEEGINSKIYQIGTKPISGCMACRACAKLGKCVIDDEVNKFVDYAKDFDAFVLGSPVYYAAATGNAVSFLNRAFFSAFLSGRGDIFAHKPGAAVASARRAGTTVTLDQLNKYFTISQMPIISGRYWNMVHGRTAFDAEQDLEGMQNMRILARNMAYYLKCVKAGKDAGIELPKQEEVVFTDFIR